jgi:acetyl esterase/lipase
MSKTSTRHLVDPDLLGVIDAAPEFDLTLETLQEARRGFGTRVMIEETSDVKAGIETTKISIPGPANSPEVGIVVHQPRKPASSRGGILHVHGGGYVVGDPYVLAPAHRQLAFSLGCVVVSVDYRLAPETRFPGAVEDCYATLTWMNKNAGELALDADRLGVMGESAGGGLAAGLALLARDRGEFGLAFQHLIYRCSTIAPARPTIATLMQASSSGSRRTTTLAGRVCWASSRVPHRFRYTPPQRARRISTDCRPRSSSPARSICSWTRTWSMRDD